METLHDRIIEVEKLHNIKGCYVSREPLRQLFEFSEDVTKVFNQFGIYTVEEVYTVKKVLALQICDVLLDLDDKILDIPFYA